MQPGTRVSLRHVVTRPLARRLAIWLAAAVALGLAACGGSGSSTLSGPHQSSSSGIAGLYGSLPGVGTPVKGGTITMGQLTGSTPTYIFPIVPTANASLTTFNRLISMLFLPLYTGPNGARSEIDYGLSLANKPVFSDGDKTVTIPMKTNFRWSDGQPVDANDLIFQIDLVKQAIAESAANWAAYIPGLLPASISSVTASGKYTVVMHLKRAFNPGYFRDDQLGVWFPMPSTAWNVASVGGPHLDFTVPANAKKIYDYLSSMGGQVATFASNPLWKVVDGPFVLKSFSPINGSYTLAANPSYAGSPKPMFSQLQVENYTGITPQLIALQTGSLDIASLDFSQLGEAGTLRSDGYSVFGYPVFGWYGAFFNFNDSTGHFNSIISQLYVRQALAELEDQPAYLSGIYKNAAVLAYAPVPSVPPNPYTPPDAIKPPYPFDPAAAVALLRAHGWHVVPNGTTTCANAGTGPDQCGAGIPAGTPLTFTWFYAPPSATPSISLESEAFASEAKQAAGINIQLESKTFNTLIANYNDANPSDVKYTNDWGVVNFGPDAEGYYPTTKGIFDTGGNFNQGAYSNPTADKLINDSVYGSKPKAVTTEALFIAQNLPVLFFPNSDEIVAVSHKVGGPPGSWIALAEDMLYPQYWYLTK